MTEEAVDGFGAAVVGCVRVVVGGCARVGVAGVRDCLLVAAFVGWHVVVGVAVLDGVRVGGRVVLCGEVVVCGGAVVVGGTITVTVFVPGGLTTVTVVVVVIGSWMAPPIDCCWSGVDCAEKLPLAFAPTLTEKLGADVVVSVVVTGVLVTGSTVVVSGAVLPTSVAGTSAPASVVVAGSTVAVCVEVASPGTGTSLGVTVSLLPVVSVDSSSVVGSSALSVAETSWDAAFVPVWSAPLDSAVATPTRMSNTATAAACGRYRRTFRSASTCTIRFPLTRCRHRASIVTG
ncbi:hypothetical protein [Nocardia vaccinii]|uniref:hypothetical protein n=1 Tax=Nocardia vaccinii TaxID=1822 RepID=UPI0012F51B24|nr:hypothetical protein [Nocardia vaccinii]